MSIGQLIGEQGWRLSIDEEIAKKPIETLVAEVPKPRLLTTAEIIKTYGDAGDPDNMIIITSPYLMKIAWDKSKTTNRLLVNKKVAPLLLAVMNELLVTYGLNKIQALGIDLYGGLYNFRPMRGLESKYAAAVKAENFTLANTYLSRHSWATAIDLDPERNQLKWKSPKAQFSKPEYKPMIETFYKHGFISYGVERNNDFMHFEIGILL